MNSMKNIPILLLLFLLGCGTAMAQPIRKSSYEQTLRAARAAYDSLNYVYALERYEEAYEDKEDRALIDTIAWLNFQIRDYRKAERWFARVLRRAEEGELNDFRYIYGQLLKMNEKYDEAIEEFQTFLNASSNDSLKALAQNEMAGAELAKELPQTMKGVTVENAGRDLNTKFSEYSPTLGANGTEVYFTTFDADDVIYVDEKNKDESYAQIYRAMKDDNGWEKPKALGGEINRPEFHNSNVALDKDGRTLYFTRAQLMGNVLSESKIYFSTGGSEGWKGAQEVQGVNGPYLAKHPAAGELFGKEVLFFVSDMPGGYGGFDLYYATKTGEGTFSDPVNLGDVINTAGDDETAELVKRFQAEAGTCKRFVLDGVSKSVVESIRRTQTAAVTTEEGCGFGDLVDVCANARIGFEEFLKRSTDNGVHAAINVVADKVVQLGRNTRSCIGRVVTVYHTLSARGLQLTAKKRVSIFNTDPLQQFRIWSAQSSTGV